MLLAFCLRNKKVLGKKLESLGQKFFLVSQPIFAQIRDQRPRHIYKTIWLWKSKKICSCQRFLFPLEGTLNK